MAINFAKFIIIASLISGSITYITGLNGDEYYELPVVQWGCTLTTAEAKQVTLWVSSIMENKTITDDKIAQILTLDLRTLYSSSSWIVIVNPPTCYTFGNATNSKACIVTYQGKRIFVWNSTC
jgi:hypothetical protein